MNNLLHRHKTFKLRHINSNIQESMNDYYLNVIFYHLYYITVLVKMSYGLEMDQIIVQTIFMHFPKHMNIKPLKLLKCTYYRIMYIEQNC